MVTVEFNRLAVKPGYKILDIGCGSGRHICAAYRLPKVIAVGADLDFDDLKEAGERLKLHDRLGEHGGGAWGLGVADIGCLPFKDDCFDLVIGSEVLEHIENYLQAIREIVRVLKPGSNLVVSVPRYWPERICWALSTDYYTAAGGHLRIFSSKQLIADLQNAGVKPWARHYAHSLHTPFWWLKCLVGPNRVNSLAVNLYHRFLTWDIMKQPRATRMLDYLLNPILGKSIVVYLRKE
ncbi:MAG: class I SAM-dependent methyltransferase [Deltaproteobacteria bacterium]|jgi:SAM-dependent methyltransferase|nr:class I SAM-dependent methyltransferase [Deltaproteobacteria bacterium]